MISLDSHIHALRAQLEPSLTPSAVLLVTSAEKGDGQTLVAFGLAESFAKAGYRVAVIDANPSVQPKGSTAVESVAADRADVRGRARPNGLRGYAEILLANQTEPDVVSYPQVKALVDQCRADYEYTIVDCAEFGGSSLPGLLSRCADGALVALRDGRRPTARDEHLVRAIEEGDTPVLGIVLVPKSAMKAFADRSDARTTPEQHRAPLGVMSPGTAT